jgi:hypothetical protein
MIGLLDENLLIVAVALSGLVDAQDEIAAEPEDRKFSGDDERQDAPSLRCDSEQKGCHVRRPDNEAWIGPFT